MTIAGSKRKFAKYICPILQKTIDEKNIQTFVDCCCGGCNITMHMAAPHRIAIDKNENLIELWKALQDPDFMLPSDEIPTREDWDRCKSGEESRKWYRGLVEFGCSYMTGGFTRGYTRETRNYINMCKTLQRDRDFVKDVEFIYDDYHLIQGYEGCVIYVDPPYLGDKGYSSDRHFSHEDFWQVIRGVSQRNYVYVSEVQAPEDFVPVWTMETLRSLIGNTAKKVEHLWVYSEGLAWAFNQEQKYSDSSDSH